MTLDEILNTQAGDVIAPESSTRVLTSEQSAWVEEVCAGRGCFLSARAGTGKTTTIVEACKECASRGLSLPAVIAFNKRIAEELKTRLPAGTQVQTLHSLGFATLRDFARSARVNPSKTYDLLSKKHLRNTPQKPKRWKDTYALVGLLKAFGYIPLNVPSIFRSVSLLQADDLGDLCVQHRLFDADPEVAVETLRESLQNFLSSQEIDYSDMVYLPYALGLRPKIFASKLLIDEAQDLSQLDLSFLSRAECALFPVGDPFQSLYGWRGAVPDIIKRLRLREFPLTNCWRCGSEIIRCAQSWVPDIRAGRSEAGKVEWLTEMPDFKALEPAVVLSRTNADLIDMALPLLAQGSPVCFLGKNFAEDLIEDVKGFKANGYEGLHAEIDSWASSMGAKYPQLDFEFKNKAKILLGLLTLYPNKPALISTLSTLFSDSPRPGAWIFSTVHASKGLEFPKVYLAAWEQKEYDSDNDHRNLMYVAITRAKDSLNFFDLKEPEHQKPVFDSTSYGEQRTECEDNFLF